jgi:Ca2+-transporting ATPase
MFYLTEIFMEERKGQYYKLSPEAALSDLQTSFDGLKKEDIPMREKIYGKNMLTELSHESTLKKFLKQFKDALIILLIVATVISLYLQDYRGASILAILLLINAFIGYFQEAKAAKIMDSLKKMLHPVAKVKRDGKIIEVNASELVPGDIVFIDE